MEYLHQRGPENFNQICLGKEQFAHALLSTKGKKTQQPFVNPHGYLLYNGSTYNTIGNDTSWIGSCLDNNLQNTIDVIRSLVGEYALSYITDQHIVFCTDQWSTKNLWFHHSGKNKKLIVSSSKLLVEQNADFVIHAKPNTIYVVDKADFKTK